MVTDAATALEILADPERRVPAPAPAGEHGGLAWLRTRVSRFAEDDEHAGRRALVELELGRLDPSGLRAAAAARSGTSREIVVAVLLEALDARPADVDAVLTVGPSYLAGDPTPELDEAARRVLACWAHLEEEVAVARAAIVLQACEATGALIEGARELGSISTRCATARRSRCCAGRGCRSTSPPFSGTVVRSSSSGAGGGRARGVIWRWLWWRARSVRTAVASRRLSRTAQ